MLSTPEAVLLPMSDGGPLPLLILAGSSRVAAPVDLLSDFSAVFALLGGRGTPDGTDERDTRDESDGRVELYAC